MGKIKELSLLFCLSTSGFSRRAVAGKRQLEGIHMNRNVEMLEETLKIERDGGFILRNEKVYLKLSAKQTREAVYISQDEANDMRVYPNYNGPVVMGRCGYRVENKDSFEAAYDIMNDFLYDKKGAGKVLVLNFANSIHPGGGARKGAKAQEEDLCRKSTLLVSLESKDAEEYYDTHREYYSELASDAMILSPNVEVIRDSRGRLLKDSYVVSVLTCAAPRNGLEMKRLSEKEYEELLYNRILCMLHVAVAYEYKYLVLGAWGCGAFGNDAEVVARMFYKALKDIRCGRLCENSLFRRIVFAVLDKSDDLYNYNAFHKYFDNFYQDEDDAARHAAEKVKKEKEKYLNKIAGCMIGGAVGDALGYAVEFDSYDRILNQYGCKGITQYDLNKDGIAVISDDTQMSLFTANGILVGYTRGNLRGIMGPIEGYVHYAYGDWLITQEGGKEPEYRYTWLLDVPELYARRAPGNTCLSALHAKTYGTIEEPINDSKGCGGIMRVAPLALHEGCKCEWLDELSMEGAKIAALTHGHPLGYMPAAALVYILNRVVYSSEQNLKGIVIECKEMLQRNFANTPHLEELLQLIDKAITLSQNSDSDIENIRKLGEGWVAEETLAIALYCSLKYQNDFTSGIIASVNHGGDSDSTGAVTGNILGALLGLNSIDGKWKKNLELYDVIEEIAVDLCHGCLMTEYGSYEDDEWLTKYVYHRRVSVETLG